MAEAQLKEAVQISPYAGERISLVTKHKKSKALKEPFRRILGAEIAEYPFDTDMFGAFSGEIGREGTPLDCARKKCELGLEKSGSPFGLASEGSFGPHPYIAFIPAGHEILYFIDKKRDFHLHLSEVFLETNFQGEACTSYEMLLAFAERTMFPSHALMLSPYPKQKSGVLFKGLKDAADLKSAFKESCALSSNGSVWVETDMRAHFNPTRMGCIGKLGEKLAFRLSSLCPSCHTPGWGETGQEAGMPCAWCGGATHQIQARVFSCVKCDYSQKNAVMNEKADPQYCPSCNP